MVKPITIEAVEGGYSLSVNNPRLSGVVYAKEGLLHVGKASELRPDGPYQPHVFSTPGEALATAHRIGRYKLGLGDFVSTYVSAPPDFEGL